MPHHRHRHLRLQRDGVESDHHPWIPAFGEDDERGAADDDDRPVYISCSVGRINISFTAMRLGRVTM
jgi:hypothetical protein